ncbi:Solute carrier organic anion transporter family member 3A1, partial [Myotis davidii]
VSVLTTLERRFNLQSADVGVIASSFEIGNLALILFVSYFGARGHRPRLIGCGGIGRDVCAANGTASDQGPDPDLICRNRTTTNMMYLLLIGAQVLLGIGATPVQPLGVSYIDDHVRRKDSSLYIGILFTMLVFGPACGFILGSFCTKIYVDAVFIDTSKRHPSVSERRHKPPPCLGLGTERSACGSETVLAGGSPTVCTWVVPLAARLRSEGRGTSRVQGAWTHVRALPVSAEAE